MNRMLNAWYICALCFSTVLTVAVAQNTAQTEAFWLSSLDVSRIEQGWGQARANRSVDNRALTIAGQRYQNGIGTHANSVIPLLLDGKGVELSGGAGLDDETGGRGSVVFQIVADGKEIWNSGVMRSQNAAKFFSLDVKGYKTVDLLVQDAGDGIDYDHADWVDLKVTMLDNARPKLDVPPIEEAVILTPKPAPTPRINGAKVFDVRPGSPFFFRIAATGDRPITFSADGLPSGLRLDSQTGLITGHLEKEGEYNVTLHAKNALGQAEREFRIVCGPQIGLTPAMGWNSWNCFANSVTADKIKAAADALVNSGLIDHGWTYINIDDFWQVHRDSNDPTLQGPHRDSNGRILPNPRFPDMAGLTDYVHGKGLKIGIYSVPGPWTCGGCVGSFGYELQDAQQYAEWGFDYLKYDWCSYNPAFEAFRGSDNWNPSSRPNITYTGGGDPVQGRLPFKRMQEALAQQPRDIIYSLCQYGMGNVWEWGTEVGGNSWRTTQDITDTWASMAGIGFAQAGHEKYAGPGHFNDPDMLVVGKVGWGPQLRNSRLSPNEQYTHISLWCLLASPLLIGCDMTQLDEFTLNLLTNDEVIEVNQDPLGRQAGRIAQNGTLEVWAKDMEDGSKAVGLFNRGQREQTVTVNWSDLGITGEQTVRDLWRQKDIGNYSDKFEANVGRHGVVLVKIAPLFPVSPPTVIGANRPPVTVSSPNAIIHVDIQADSEGQLTWSVRRQDKLILAPAPLGLTVDGRDLGKSVTLGELSRYAVDERYPMWGNHSVAVNRCNGVVIPAESAGGRNYELEVRAYDDGAAVRTRITLDENTQCAIAGEATSWSLPSDSLVWWSEYDNSYEKPYRSGTFESLPANTPLAPPITFQIGDNLYIALTEANNNSFPDMGLVRQGGFIKAVFPPSSRGWRHRGTIVTPWRAAIIAEGLNALVNSDLITNLCPAPSDELANADWIKPGRVLWQWWSIGAPRLDDQKEWVDAAKYLGFEYYLIDDGWRRWSRPGKDQWQCLKEVIDYAKTQGVGCIVWVDSSEMRTAEARRTYLERVAALGAAGIKIDFISPCTPEIARWYEESLKDTAELRLLCNFHGSVKLTGRQRTWPHELTREAVRGHEYHMTRYRRVQAADHDQIVLFARYLTGPADYTPTAFDPREMVGFTWAHLLAQAVNMTSPLQHFAGKYQDFIGNPSEDLLRHLPSVWDETIVLPGTEIGKTAAFARRRGREWFIGVLNGATPVTLPIELSFLGSGAWNAELFGDQPDNPASFKQESKSVTAGDTLVLPMSTRGGAVVWIRHTGN